MSKKDRSHGAEIKEKVNAESYFTAEEAVEFGLADEIDENDGGQEHGFWRFRHVKTA